MGYIAAVPWLHLGKGKMEMAVYKRGTKWHYAFAIRGVRYRGSIPEARTKFQAEQAETKLRQDVFDGRYGRPSGKEDFVKFVDEVYKPWARENKRSFESNDKYKLPMICASRCFHCGEPGRTWIKLRRMSSIWRTARARSLRTSVVGYFSPRHTRQPQ